MQASVPAFAPTLAVVDGKATTLSTDVARHFGKRHDHVLRDIDNLRAQMDENHLPNFGETVEKRENPSGGAPIESRAYRLTRDGFTLLAMGFTGKRALAFKLAYIDAFNRMEAALLAPPATITPAQQQHLKELVDLVAESGRQTHGETWARLHRKFGVPRYTDLPAGEFDAACQYLRGKLDAPSIATLVQKHLPDAAPPSIKGRRWLVSFDHLGNEQHLALDWNDCVIKYADMPGLIESGAIFDADLIARIGQACLARLLEKQQASALAAQHLRSQIKPQPPALA
ncbi:MAG: Rha family transcriptional regulator [Pseudomonadota bacterium]|nr:Rha family transcriptional regulator [Pseudomonadota bacterium]